MDIPIGSLVGSLELQDNLTPALQRANQQLELTNVKLQAFGGGLDAISRQAVGAGLIISRIGDRLTALAIPLVAAGVASGKFSVEFQTNLTKLVTTAGVAEKSIAGIRDAIFKMGPEVAKTPNELAEALYPIASVGFKGAEALEILGRSAKASAVGLGDTKEIAKAVTAAIANYGSEGLTAARATDILLAAVREGGAEADAFARTLGRVIAPAKLVGVSFEEVTASVATFTRLGVRADEAVTALRGTLGFLLKPAAQTKDALASIGTTIEEVRKSVKERGLAETLIQLVQLAGQNENAIGKIIPNIRALSGVLANAGSQAAAYREVLDKIKNSTGDLDAAFNTVSQTAQFKFAQLTSRLQEIAITLGDRLIPVFLKVADAIEPILVVVTDLIVAFGKLPQFVQTSVIALGGLTLLSGPLLSFGGRFIEMLGLIGVSIAGIIKTIPGGINILEGLSNAYRGVASTLFFHSTALRADTAAYLENAGAAKIAGDAAVVAGNKFKAGSFIPAATTTAGGFGVSAVTGTATGWSAEVTAKNAITQATEQSAGALKREAEAIEVLLGYRAAETLAAHAAVKQAAEMAAADIILGKETVTLGAYIGGLATSLTGLAIIIPTVFVGGIETAAALTGKTKELHDAISELPAALMEVGGLIKDVLAIPIDVAKDAIREIIPEIKTFVQELPGVMPVLKAVGDLIQEQIDRFHFWVLVVKEARKEIADIKSGLGPVELPPVGGFMQIKPDELDHFKYQLDQLVFKAFPGVKYWQDQFKNPILLGLEEDAKNIPENVRALGNLNIKYANMRSEVEAAQKAVDGLTKAQISDMQFGLKHGETVKDVAADFVKLGLTEHTAEIAARLFNEQFAQTSTTAKAQQKAIHDVEQAYQELTETQKAVIKANTLQHITDETTAKQLGINIAQVRSYKEELKEIPDAIHDVFEVAEKIAQISDRLDLKDLVDLMKEGINQVSSRMESFADFADGVFDRVAMAQMTRSDEALAQIEANRRRELNGLKVHSDAAEAVINEYYDFLKRKQEGTPDTFQARLKDQGILTTPELKHDLEVAIQDFDLMTKAVDDTGQALYGAAARMQAWDAATQKAVASMGLFGQTAYHALSAIPGLLQQAFTGGGGVTGFAKALGSMVGSDLGKGLFTPGVGAFGSLTQGLLSGTGALAGFLGKGLSTALGAALPAIGAAIGAFAGPLIEKFIGIFKKPEWKQVSNAIKSQFGQISDELAKQITDLENTLIGGTEKQRRELATLLSLDKIIDEQGGLNPKNLAKYEKAAAGLFDTIAAGGQYASKAQDQLNSLVGKFAAQADKTGGLWDANFRMIIQRAKELNISLESITSAVDAQVTKLASGFGKMVSGFSATIQKIFGDQDITRGIDAALKESVNKAQTEFDRLSRIGLSAFNAIIASGRNAFDAIITLDDPIGQLIAAHDKLGLAGSAAYDQLSRIRNLVKDNKALVESVAGLNDALVATANLGGLNADVFKDFQDQLVADVAQLELAGFTESEALAASKSALETIIKLHRERGFAIDEETQKLIDAAEEQGILSADAMSLNDILMDGLSALIKGFGFDLPESFRKAAKAAEDMAARADRAVDGITTQVDVNVVVNRRGDIVDSNFTAEPGRGPDTDAAEVAWTGGMIGAGKLIPFPMIQAAHMAEGGPISRAQAVSSRVIAFEPKNSDRVPIMADPAEIILNTAMQKNVAQGIVGSHAGDLPRAMDSMEVQRTGTDDEGDVDLHIHLPPGDYYRALTEGSPITVQRINQNYKGLRNMLLRRDRKIGGGV